MSRFLFECTTVFRSPAVNSGIQRVVRNIVRHLPSQTATECIPVVFAHNRLYRVNQLMPGPEGQTAPARAHTYLDRLNQAFWRVHSRYEATLPLCRWHNGRRLFFVCWRLLGLPISLSMRVLSLLGYDPLTLRAEPFEVLPDDQLILLDSSWHAQNFTLIERLKGQGLGVVAVIYDLIPVTRPEFFEERLRGIFNTWFDWIIHHADGYMSISRSVRDQVREELASRLELEATATAQSWHGYFHLGSELDLRGAGQLPAPELVELFRARSRVYLAVSTIEPRKNHEYLLNAFELAWAAGSEASLCIIGRVGWKCDALIKRIREHVEFGQRLFMFNDIDDSGLEFAYSHAASLVFSSHAEGFGLPLVEAMQRGLPAMGSDLPVFREIGGDYMAYFDLQRPQSLADLVLRFDREGAFPAPLPLADWRWIDWAQSAEQLACGVIAATQGAKSEKADAHCA